MEKITTSSGKNYVFRGGDQGGASARGASVGTDRPHIADGCNCAGSGVGDARICLSDPICAVGSGWACHCFAGYNGNQRRFFHRSHQSAASDRGVVRFEAAVCVLYDPVYGIFILFSYLKNIDILLTF